jgi:hypothetical protein
LVGGLVGARDHATRLVQSFSRAYFVNWRERILHVSNDHEDELFVVPFTFVLSVGIGDAMFPVFCAKAAWRHEVRQSAKDAH